MKLPSSLTIRRATLSDAPAIFGLIREHPEELVPRSLGDIAENIDRFFVAESEAGLLGCASWKIYPEIGAPEKASVEVQSVAVKTAFRRQGIGAALIQKVIGAIGDFGATQAIVLTFAPAFFSTLGFHEISKTQVMYKLYTGCMGCTKHADPFTCPEIAMALKL